MRQVFVTSVLMCISSDNYRAYHIRSVHTMELRKKMGHCLEMKEMQFFYSGVLCKGKRKCFGAIVDLVELQAKLCVSTSHSFKDEMGRIGANCGGLARNGVVPTVVCFPGKLGRL